MKLSYKLLFLLTFVSTFIGVASDRPEVSEKSGMSEPKIKKVLFIGDSMTGWMADRLNAYGELNDFKVSTVIWDGSTVKKWGTADALPELIEKSGADAVFLSLGLNELLIPNPSSLDSYVDNILEAVGNRHFLWVGPPSWPGRPGGEALNNGLEKKLGTGRFFRCFDMTIPRQSAKNPHPSKAGSSLVVDELMKWVPTYTNMNFGHLQTPADEKMVRSKDFVYKRMKENL